MINGLIVFIGYKYSIYGEQSTYMELIKNKIKIITSVPLKRDDYQISY